MSCTEITFPSATIAEHNITLCKCWRYKRIAGGALGSDVAAQRRYGETI